MNYLLTKLMQKDKRQKMFRERLTEPLHLNVLSLLCAAFGSFSQKVSFDLIPRQQNAYSLMKAAEFARWVGLSSLTVIEFGVATGAGLMNMCRISERVTKATGVQFKIYGFDSGVGLPAPRDHRDMPYAFAEGAFPPGDHDQLRRALPSNAELIIGDVTETLPAFLAQVDEHSPLGFVAVDVDYYWSAKECLRVFSDANPKKYLPMTMLYLDDIGIVGSNPWVGELLAVNEFNAEHKHRKIHPEVMLRSRRIFKQPQWIDQIFIMHTFDHQWRSTQSLAMSQVTAANPYLGIK